MWSANSDQYKLSRPPTVAEFLDDVGVKRFRSIILNSSGSSSDNEGSPECSLLLFTIDGSDDANTSNLSLELLDLTEEFFEQLHLPLALQSALLQYRREVLLGCDFES